jgi:hypothetical protein
MGDEKRVARYVLHLRYRLDKNSHSVYCVMLRLFLS